MEQNKTSKMKRFFRSCGQKIVANRQTLYLAIPFLVMDLLLRILGFKIRFYPAYYPVPNLFTILWIILFVGLITSFKTRIGKILYWVFFLVNFIMFVTHNVYRSMTTFYFSFNLLKMADEGSSYILDTIIHTNPLIYLMCLAVLAIAILVYRKMPAVEKFRPKHLIVILIIFLVGHTLTPLLLGSANSALKWNSFKNARNLYNNFSDYNKCMKISGLYEYTFRNFYVTFLKPDAKMTADDAAFLKEAYTPAGDATETNDYTGIFEGKNLIFLQLEGLDQWLLTKEDTPNLYQLRADSINFQKHYSMYTGGGSTFNSEFAVNTGFITPLSFVENVYSFNTNTFDHTMARYFKQKGYTVNAFHMNSGDFYSRNVNYQSWGYDHYYGLAETGDYSDLSYELDRELILNKTFYKNMFQQDGNFVDYIITYSPHTPFSTEKGVGKMLAEEKYAGQSIPLLSEEECARLAASETDYMVGLLIQALKDNDLYDNTAIVTYADHYLYTLNNKSILDKYKETDNNLINNTSLFIWSSDIKPQSVDKVTMQTNILPTVLNLFGIEYDSSYFLCQDALDKDYDGFAFFPDYSWYDGNVYVENSKITNDGKMNKKNLNAKEQMIEDIIRKNDLTLKFDYFKKD